MVSIKDISVMVTEFLGSFFIVFTTCWSYTVLRTEKGPNYLAIAITNGLMTAAVVWAGVTFSGAHFNPVITLVKLFARTINLNRAALYLVSQLSASFLATLLILLMSPSFSKQDASQGFIFPEKNERNSYFQAFVMEGILSMLYVFVYFATIIDKRAPSNIFGFALGAVIMLGTLAAGPFSGGVVNPARIFGPYIVRSEVHDMINYWLAMVGGGVFAGFYYDFFLIKNEGMDDEDEHPEASAVLNKSHKPNSDDLRF